MLQECFVLYKPKDIVSGDFYWIGKKENKVIVVGGDCTGHGVPGAFMSLLGIAYLNEIVNTKNIVSPDEILNSLRLHIIKTLNQNSLNGDSKDGIDMTVITIDVTNNKIEFAGANNSLYLITDNKLRETKGDKMPVAIHEIMKPFSKHEWNIQKDDTIYVFSDGFADQFGGPRGKKFKYNAFRKLLLDVHHNPMWKQKILIEEVFEDWKGHTNPDTAQKYEQIDDVLVMGIKV
jgi:serine phosphatase RsbU (regulator of sigma subunit)